MKTATKTFFILLAIAAITYGMYLLRGEKSEIISLSPSPEVSETIPTPKLARETEALSINIAYPAIPGSSQKILAANLVMKNTIDAQIASFEKDANESFSADIGLPLDIKSTVTGSPITEEKNDRYIALFMGMEWYLRGAAHPSHSLETYVYDFKEARLVEVSELFKPKADYLAALSALSRADLLAQSKQGDVGFSFDKEMVEEGTQPVKENFSKVLPLKDGLAIYFDEYQVAPYAAGPQQVVIPYAKLKDILNPDGVAGMYIK